MALGKKPKNRDVIRTKLRGFVGSAAWTGLSFAVASFVGVAALVEMRAGPLVAGLVGLGIYGFMAYVLPTRVARQVGDQSAQDDAQNKDPRVELLVEARQHLATLAKQSPKIPAAMKAVIKKLCDEGTIITDAVTESPEKLSAVLRFFTYYLPATADLVQDRIKLAPHAGTERLAEIDQTLVRLSDAFAGFRTAVMEPDMASVDLDITLLDDALDADLEDLKTR
jgi:5-bromo-4-chloroindolyl phosphate hydrolysis protein